MNELIRLAKELVETLTGTPAERFAADKLNALYEALEHARAREVLVERVVEAAGDSVGINNDGTAGFQPECGGYAQDVFDSIKKLDQFDSLGNDNGDGK